MSGNEPVTELLQRWRNGDQQASNELAELVYADLRRVAGNLMHAEREGHTLEPTALVNEMYLRLFRSEPVDWQNRAHFFGVAARQLRRILVNHARDRSAGKRGGDRVRLTVTSLDSLAGPSEQDLLDVDRVLEQLEQFDPRAARVVEMRFFAGLTEPEMAEALGVSLATLKRDWAFARAWLSTHLG